MTGRGDFKSTSWQHTNIGNVKDPSRTGVLPRMKTCGHQYLLTSNLCKPGGRPRSRRPNFRRPDNACPSTLRSTGQDARWAPQVRAGLASDDCATCARRRSLQRFPTMMESLRPNLADGRRSGLLCRSELICRQPLAEIPPKESTLAPDQFPFLPPAP